MNPFYVVGLGIENCSLAQCLHPKWHEMGWIYQSPHKVLKC